MFGFSPKKMKLGRFKALVSNSAAEGTGSPVIRHPKPSNSSNSEHVPAASSNSDAAPEISNPQNWTVLSVSGDKPTPRFNHAAAVIGNKMIVVGGESGDGLLDDVQVLNFDNFTWTTASSKLYLSPSTSILPLKVPACKGHRLVSWGKKALLIGGKTEPGSDKISVWAFDTETECWSHMEAKGDIPVARTGHAVVRASSVLILFGGEDSKRRKMNDLHMFDLKTLTWLPLHCTGTGPSPRSKHVTALYDDKTLFLFGGKSKSRTLNDLYSLDFETMVWSRIKNRGFHPLPRAGCCGVLCGTKWYIVGGGSKKKRYSETLIFDILKLEWLVPIESPPSSITTNKGFSLELVPNKEKYVLVSFGGCRKEPSNQVEVLTMGKSESSMNHRSFPRKGPVTLLPEKPSSSTGLAGQLSNGSSQRSVNSASKQNLAPAIKHHGSGRKSLSVSFLVDKNPVSGNVSRRKQFHKDEEYNATVKGAKSSEDESSFLQQTKKKTSQSDSRVQTNMLGGRLYSEDILSSFEFDIPNPHHHGIGNVPVDSNDAAFPENDSKISAPSSIYHYYESKMATLIRKNGILEGQLAAALASREAAEKSLSSALKSRQKMEKKLTDSVKEMEMLKEKVAGVELAQESNNLSNIVYSDNVSLQHDVAFLKAVLDDTQKELHSTREILTGERARAFQLQVEVFQLKQRLQSMESRASTPRKPF